MLHHKLIAGEQPGTYLTTNIVSAKDLVAIAQDIAHKRYHLHQHEPDDSPPIT